MRIVFRLIFIYGLVLITGCQSNLVNSGTPFATAPSETSEPAAPTQGDISMTPAPLIPTEAGLQALIEKVKADLAQRLSTSVTQINLVEVAAVEWSDSGLGCPQPGMDYLQVITPGYLIRLEANAQIYEYHSNRDLYFVLCDNSTSSGIPKP